MLKQSEALPPQGQIHVVNSGRGGKEINISVPDLNSVHAAGKSIFCIREIGFNCIIILYIIMNELYLYMYKNLTFKLR